MAQLKIGLKLLTYANKWRYNENIQKSKHGTDQSVVIQGNFMILWNI